MRSSVQQTVPGDNPFDDLGAALLDKLGTEQVDFAMQWGDQLPGFHPVPNKCHDNAEGDPDTHSPYRFLAHSVVLTTLGGMIGVPSRDGFVRTLRPHSC